jgi:hypothetical protein
LTAITISGDLIAHVRIAFYRGLHQAIASLSGRDGINAYTPVDAFPAYITAVASVEAFLHEQLCSPWTRSMFPGSSLWRIPIDTLDIRTKIILVPQLLFGISFDTSAQPAQDFMLLVKVRNDLVHYKMQQKAPKYLADLSQRRIALTSDLVHTGGLDYAWPHKLSSTEGIRWAHNTACKVIHKLVEFIPAPHKEFLGSLASNYQEILEEHVQELLARHEAAANP